MKTAPAFLPRVADPRFADPLIPAQSDRLGERWTTVDTNDSTPVELLRFSNQVATAPGFEDALRARVAVLTGFTHPGFASVREVLKENEHLTLVSRRAQGQRLSQLSSGKLAKAQRPAFVTRMLRDATSALAALESTGPDVTHGALTADRIVLTAEGHVCITDHALGPALQQLALWPEELWTEFGLLARADEDGQAVFDARTTVMQLAVAALSVLLGRPITLQDFENRLPALLEEFDTRNSSTSSRLVAPLRTWLAHALQIGPETYASAAEAEAGLKKLLAALGPEGAVELDTFQFQARPATRAHERDTVGAAAGSRDGRGRVAGREDGAIDSGTALKGERHALVSPSIPAPLASDNRFPAAWRSWGGGYLKWAVLALAIAALGEGMVIAWLLARPPVVTSVEPTLTIESPGAGDTIMVDGRPIGATPVRIRVNSQMRAIRLVPAQPAAPTVAIDAEANAAKADADKAAAVIAQAAARQRSGGVAFKSPIELKVFEGDRVLGSTADGPIVASAGTHQLDLVNTALGYRTRQTVTIRAGVIGPVTVTPPMGRISINAQPWAQVLIDDTAVGETPLANIPVALGDHQITFRHPQLGERRERVTVRADAPARVSTTFQR